MKFSSLNISDFRGITNLSIENFANINILVGRNNSGKTTILEGIFLLSGLRNSSLIANISILRGGLAITEPDEFRFVFNNLELSKNPNLSCLLLDKSKMQLELIPKYRSSYANFPQPSPSIGTNQSESIFNKRLVNLNGDIDPSIESLEFRSILVNSTGKEEKFTSTIKLEIEKNNINYKTEPEKAGPPISFKTIFQTTSNNFYIELAHRVDKLIQAKSKIELIEGLRVIDERVIDISISSNSVIYVDIGGSRLVPINIMGDGIIKFLATIVNIYTSKNGILLIDEIENGLHFSSLINLWKLILKLSAKYNVQVFLTTHSIEVLKYLNQVLEVNDFADNKDKIMIYTIQNLFEKGHKAYKYDMESLKFSFENNIEIRGQV